MEPVLRPVSCGPPRRRPGGPDGAPARPCAGGPARRRTRADGGTRRHETRGIGGGNEPAPFPSSNLTGPARTSGGRSGPPRSLRRQTDGPAAPPACGASTPSARHRRPARSRAGCRRTSSRPRNSPLPAGRRSRAAGGGPGRGGSTPGAGRPPLPRFQLSGSRSSRTPSAFSMVALPLPVTSQRMRYESPHASPVRTSMPWARRSFQLPIVFTADRSFPHGNKNLQESAPFRRSPGEGRRSSPAANPIDPSAPRPPRSSGAPRPRPVGTAEGRRPGPLLAVRTGRLPGARRGGRSAASAGCTRRGPGAGPAPSRTPFTARSRTKSCFRTGAYGSNGRSLNSRSSSSTREAGGEPGEPALLAPHLVRLDPHAGPTLPVAHRVAGEGDRLAPRVPDRPGLLARRTGARRRSRAGGRSGRSGGTARSQAPASSSGPGTTSSARPRSVR